MASKCFLIVDTNILVDVPDIRAMDWGVESGKIFILESVLNELQVLAGRIEAPDLARKADRAFTYLGPLTAQARNGGFSLTGNNRLHFVQAPQGHPQYLDPTDVDHQQISLAVKLLKEHPDSFVAVITQDQIMADIAHAVHADLEVINPGNGDPAKHVGRRIANLKAWKDKLREERAAANRGRLIKEAVPKPKHEPDPAEIKQNIARSLYARIRSAHHRAILAISPLDLRLTLSAHMIPILSANKRRVVALFVEDERAAGWWAAELQRRCNLPDGSIISFNGERVQRWAPVRAVIYRYDQIERRLPHHIARFKHANKKITALVDGCDLLDPVAIAMLLFECDQFIGFNRLPGDHAQAVGGRMLNAFFQQQTVASYTFADAEQDGWLHAFDVIRHPVSFAPDELQYYRSISDEFVQLHSEVSRRYPELQRAASFWPALLKILAKHVDHKAADLFSLHEQMEELAQMARGKIDVVHQLITETRSPARCIILDDEQVWTKVLEKQLRDQQWQVQVVEKEASVADWHSAWSRFASAKLDCLIIQGIPPLGLPPALINRLILLSTLTPLTKLAAATDWALSLANSGPSVCVDLLYTAGTPEQEAMIAFADTCCGLRFN